MTRILVVDDNAANICFLKALLEGAGFAVISAGQGIQALEHARLSPPDLVVSDLLMPQMDGYTLLRHWRADAALKTIPFIVFTSAYSAAEDEELAKRLGADAFVLKPSAPDQLLVRIREVLARGTVATGLAEDIKPGEMLGTLREYNDLLVRKLENKTRELEDSNRHLLEDVARREAAENALRESEERFRQLAESIDDAFWLVNAETRELVYVSPAFEKIWGWTPDELRARRSQWLSNVHPDDRERMAAAVAHSATQRWEETYRILVPGAGTKWLRSRAYPVKNAEGKVIRVAGITRDITDLRRMEEQFRHAQKMEAVGRLAGAVTHDFNNLLTVILSFTTFAAESLEPGSPARADLDEVYRAGERAVGITKQLLAFSRKQVLDARVFDLNMVIKDMQKMLGTLMGESIGLSLLPSPRPCHVKADSGLMEQVIMNLAVNARDAMPNGGNFTLETSEVTTLESTAHPVMTPGNYVLLAVTDNGTGMDAATRDKVFEPFFTTKEKGKGTGLGLSTVYGIITQSKGHISIYSEPGAGTTFRVYLPRADAEAAEPVVHRSVPPVRGEETILLVEDDAQVRSATATTLRRAGYTVLEAPDGKEALSINASFPGKVHMVISDVVLPGLTGPELVELIQKTRPGIRFLYVSGYTEASVRLHGVLKPGLFFLSKPIFPELLIHKVREVLSAPEPAQS